MDRINLLPWRELRKKHHQQRFYRCFLGAIFVSLVLCLAIYLLIEQNIQRQIERNQHLTQYLSSLDPQLIKMKEMEKSQAYLESQLTLENTWQKKRQEVVHFMTLLPQLLPEGIYLERVLMNEGQVEIMGAAETTATLSQMLQRVEASSALSQVEMVSITSGYQIFNREYQSFKLRFSFHQQ